MSRLIFRYRPIQARHSSTISRTPRIPGPKSLPLLGHAHLFSPLGPYNVERLVDAHADLFQRYGPVVGVHLGFPMVLLFEPDDVAAMFRADDHWPQRPPFEALRHYRRSKPERYKHLGLVTDNGPGWYTLRRGVSWLLRPGAINAYFEPHNKIAHEFVDRLERVMDKKGEIKDFLRETTLYAEEAIGFVCFGERLGMLKEKQSNSLSQQIRDVNDVFLDVMARTLLGIPWWKIYRTPTYRKLAECEDFMWQISSNFLSSAESSLATDPSFQQRVPFLRHLVSQPELDSRDVTLIMAEVFFGGIDATATTLGLCLHHLAKNPQVQEKLADEIRSTGNLKDRENLQKMTYLRACIKETLRVTPTAVGNARILSTKLHLSSGYEVPPNTLLISCHPVISRCPAVFTDPHMFLPERWLRCKSTPLPHPFGSLPFGFGPRMCPGKRLAEQEIQLAIVKLLSRFRVQLLDPSDDVSLLMRLNLVPDRPLNFRFERR